MPPQTKAFAPGMKPNHDFKKLVKGFKTFGADWCYYNRPFFFTSVHITISEVSSSAEAIATKYRWATREKGNLWWTTVSNRIKAKKTIRTHCARKLRRAFELSLTEHGYDAKGWSLKGREYPSLLGTLELHSKPTMLTAEFDDVRSETDFLVKWIHQQQSYERSLRSRATLNLKPAPKIITPEDGVRIYNREFRKSEDARMAKSRR